ncbi:MAG: amidase [Cellvibrionaceae bacterium]|jgi:amidase
MSNSTPHFPLLEKPVSELQQMMTVGAYTSAAIVQLYIDRIEAIDRSGPCLNSVLEINPDALDIARELDEERAAGNVRGPLHGVPIMIKGNIDTGDRMLTTAGSLALASGPAPADAFIVKKLRAAGVVIMGKTNLSEWANFRSTRSSSGWSSCNGQTRNPYALDRNPSGSSSGSSAAAAASLCALTIGTETDGSIVSPSAASGLVGIKPTVGLISRTGIIPISETQDTAGPMARNVADAASLLTVLAGTDPDDISTAGVDAYYADYTDYLNKDAFSGTKIGVVRQFFGRHPESDRQMEEAIELMRLLGAEIIDPVEMPPQNNWGRNEREVLLYEFKDGLNKYLATRGPDFPVQSLTDVIAFNKENSETAMPLFGQEILELAEEKEGLDSKEYLEALLACIEGSRVNGLDMALAGLDALIAPTRGPAWMTDHVNGDSSTAGCSSYSAVAGYPHITMPLGHTQGLPLNISFMGRPWEDAQLIALAYAFEQANPVRQPPEFRPTTGIL